ncbi:hypothetical protein RJ639_030863 [Escallonia herrerae]|uniref:General transcription factor 3C polypeptide 3 n=1 Tax=Escallonia herrerae TaxID=1293975 RepID=A0AA88X413_9ASTE|nr:hypothetical protein RJ639_030863 [Escallonia herrerae]
MRSQKIGEIEEGDTGQARYCLSKAITADPEDLSLKYDRASLYVKLGDYHKAAESYEQISRLCPKNVEALKTAAMVIDSLARVALTLYKKCGQRERTTNILEDYLTCNPNAADLSVVHLLAATHMEGKEYIKALQLIEHAHQFYCSGRELPLYLMIQAGICHVHLGNVEKAEMPTSKMSNDSTQHLVDEHMEKVFRKAILDIRDQGCERIGMAVVDSGAFQIPTSKMSNDGTGHLEELATFSILQRENVSEHPQLVFEVVNVLMGIQRYESALKYCMMLEGNDDVNSANVYVDSLLLVIFLIYCLLSYAACLCFSSALHKLEDTVEARLKLASLLLEEHKDDEAISVLSPPTNSESKFDQNSDNTKPWWLDGKIRLKLSQVYKAKGLLEAFVDAIFPSVRESLFLESIQQKVRVKKRLSRSVLSERAKVLDDCQTDTIFHGFRPLASTSELSKAARAKKLLQKKELLREEKRVAALAAGVDWKSDDSDEESPQAVREPPLPDLLRDEEHHHIIIDALTSLQRHWEALEIINLCLKLACNTLSIERKEELRSLGAQIAYSIADPMHGWDCARYIVNQHPHSFAAWNCYYKIISRLDNRYAKHNKFLHGMRVKHKDCIPPIIIFGHQLTMISQHQAAAREYLEAYKMMPDSPLINLCVGTALVNLALGLRLQNKHQCIVQGLAFLYNNLILCKSSQEALYNIARACHHVGLVSLAATYYEKVLEIHESDYPIPTLPNENLGLTDNRKPGYCDLRREAAYNLHLIYKRSGALDLARQVLKDNCSF